MPYKAQHRLQQGSCGREILCQDSSSLVKTGKKIPPSSLAADIHLSTIKRFEVEGGRFGSKDPRCEARE